MNMEGCVSCTLLPTPKHQLFVAAELGTGGNGAFKLHRDLILLLVS